MPGISTEFACPELEGSSFYLHPRYSVRIKREIFLFDDQSFLTVALLLAYMSIMTMSSIFPLKGYGCCNTGRNRSVKNRSSES